MNQICVDKTQLKSFDPQSIEELAVNNKKIQELEEWFVSVHENNRNNILLITGPVGCGKTITLKLMAKKHETKISEWVTPIDIELISDYGNTEYREKQTLKFLDFLLKSANYSSLRDNNKSKLVLVEDFPHVFIKNPAEFKTVLEQYRQRAKSPLVFICAECNSENKNMPINLFTPSLKSQFSIHHIIFNAASATNLKAALKRASHIINSKHNQSYSTPSQESIDCIVSSSCGDIRSAILNLHFACLKGVKQNLQISCAEKGVNTKVKKKVHNLRKFVSLGKDLNIGIFHAVGRVLNPKRMEDNTLSHPPREIVNEFLDEGSLFLNFLHENYMTHFSCVKQASDAAVALSDADHMMSEWRDKHCQEIGLLIGILGVMLANIKPVSAWNPVRGPKNMKLTQSSLQEIPLLDEKQNLYKTKILAVDYQTYCKLINTSKDSTLFKDNS